MNADDAYRLITARAAAATEPPDPVRPSRTPSTGNRLGLHRDPGTGVACATCGDEATVRYADRSGVPDPLCPRCFGRARHRRVFRGGRYEWRPL